MTTRDNVSYLLLSRSAAAVSGTPGASSIMAIAGPGSEHTSVVCDPGFHYDKAPAINWGQRGLAFDDFEFHRNARERTLEGVMRYRTYATHVTHVRCRDRSLVVEMLALNTSPSTLTATSLASTDSTTFGIEIYASIC